VVISVGIVLGSPLSKMFSCLLARCIGIVLSLPKNRLP
jgi:hypothetical protein